MPYLQYHNLDELGCLPGDLRNQFLPDEVDLGQLAVSCISTKKDASPAVGDGILLVVGWTPRRGGAKQYCLRGVICPDEVVREVDSDDGEVWNEFFEWMGRFGRGLTEISGHEFFGQIQALLHAWAGAVSNDEVQE